MLVKTLLNRVEKFKSFVYETVQFEFVKGAEALVVDIKPRANGTPECSICGKKSPGYDKLPTRAYEYVALWGIQVFFRYSPRRVSCPVDGIRVERVLWADGKAQMTKTYKDIPGQVGKASELEGDC